MTTLKQPTMLALAVLLLCTACAEKPTTSATNMGNQQLSSIQWDRATAAHTAAPVRNANLIMMR